MSRIQRADAIPADFTDDLCGYFTGPLGIATVERTSCRWDCDNDGTEPMGFSAVVYASSPDGWPDYRTGRVLADSVGFAAACAMAARAVIR